MCNAFVNVHNLVVIFSYSFIVIFHAVQLWFCFTNPWIWSFESHSILLNIKHAMGVTSIVYIVSYLCRIFLPSFQFSAQINYPSFFFSKNILLPTILCKLIVYKHKRRDLSINKFLWWKFIRSKVTFSN